MYTKLIFILILAVGYTIACSSPSPVLSVDWEKLGTRTVNFGIDKDEIAVTAVEKSSLSYSQVYYL